MKLSELIDHLTVRLENCGDLDCYTNGEHGINDSKALTVDEISIGPCELIFADEDDAELAGKTALHIGQA